MTSWLGVVAPLLLAAPSITSGFSSDDDIILPALDGNRIDAPAWYDLYHFAGRSLPEVVTRGILPWWTAPGLRLHFVRPLPSALLALDHAVFGHSAVGYHLHSIAWFATLLVCVRAFFLRVLGRHTGTLALLAFGLSPNLMLASRLVAARHILVTAVLVVAGLRLLIESEQRPRWRWYACLAFVLSLAGGEGALGGLALWFAYEMWGPSEPLSLVRVRRALVPVAIGIAYLGIYALVGGGARQMDIYLDPLGDPLAFLRAAVIRLPMLLGNLVWTVDAGLGAVWPRPVIVAGLVGVAMVAALLAKTWEAIPSAEAASLKWLVPGAILATIGVVGGMPGGRELVVANVGFTPLVAVLIRHGWNGARRASGSPLLGRFAVTLLAFVHLLLAPLVTVASGQLVRQAAEATQTIAHQMRTAAGSARHVVLLVGSDPAVWIYALRLARGEHPGPMSDGCWWVASAAKGEHRLMQIDPRTVRIETIDTTFLSDETVHMYRARSLPMTVGDQIAQCGALVRVTNAREGEPDRLDIQLQTTLDDPDLALLAWRNGAIMRVTPLEISRGLSIPWSAGPTGLF
jgi:hypothetical protein